MTSPPVGYPFHVKHGSGRFGERDFEKPMPRPIRAAALRLVRRGIDRRRICEFFCIDRGTLNSWIRKARRRP
jgi:transposase-like protein